MSLKNQNPRTKDELHFDSEVTVNSTTRQPKPSNPDSAQLQQKPFLPIVTHAVVWNWASTSSSTSTSFQMKTHRRTQVSADSKQATHQPTIKYYAWHLARNAASFEVSSLKKTEGPIKFVKCVNLYPLRQHVLDFYSSFFCKSHQQQTNMKKLATTLSEIFHSRFNLWRQKEVSDIKQRYFFETGGLLPKKFSDNIKMDDVWTPIVFESDKWNAKEESYTSLIS